MYDVYIRFIDGATLRFRAREFNINVAGRLPPEQKPKRFTYTDTNGRQTPIYLRLDQVADRGDACGGQPQPGVGSLTFYASNFGECTF